MRLPKLSRGFTALKHGHYLYALVLFITAVINW
ncbi:hypothetical protein X564_18585 [Pseudoalteromonas agarivorans]|nr:hypothetical protein X564_18585 [Pseudoalteromonas agarivorans]